MAEINDILVEGTIETNPFDSGDSFETSLVETSAVDMTSKGMATGTKIFIGGLAGFGIGVIAKTAFDVFRAIHRGKKLLAEAEAKKAEEDNQKNEEDAK